MQGRKQFYIRGASKVCKRRMWKLVTEVALKADLVELQEYLVEDRYLDVKNGDGLSLRRKVKEDVRNVMGGWIQNHGGEDFAIDGVEP